MKIKNNKKTEKAQMKTSKGYRLRPSTHRMIKKIQRLLSMTQDSLISKSVLMFSQRLGNKNNSITKNIKGNTINGNTKKL